MQERIHCWLLSYLSHLPGNLSVQETIHTSRTGEKSEPVQSPEFETLGRRSQVLATCKSEQTVNLVNFGGFTLQRADALLSQPTAN